MQTIPEGSAPKSPAEESGSDSKFRRDRRKLLGVGATGTVLAVLHSRAAFGSGYYNGGDGNILHSTNFSGCSLTGNNPDCSGGGLTPGFWKQYQHKRFWHPSFPPDAKFDQVFGVEVWGYDKLFDVINDEDGDGIKSDYVDSFGILGGGGDNVRGKVAILCVHAVAALQNAATPIPYDLSVAEVISQVGSVLAARNLSEIESLKNDLDFFNNQTVSGGIRWDDYIKTHT